MKITLFFLLIAVSSAFASFTYSQNTRFSLRMENVSIQQVFDEIQKKSEFIIFYKDSQIDLNHRSTINVVEATVDQVLDQAFTKTNFGYRIIDRQIVISAGNPKELPVVMRSATKVEQKNELSGTVKDSKGIFLPGVSVVVKGTTIGSITDNEGQFKLTVPAEAKTLLFSFIGMKSLELPIQGKSVFNVVLQEDIANLDEVVVVGYGTMKRRDLIGATSAMKGADIANTPVTSAAEAIIGRMAGVQVATTEGQPGADIIIKIRGGTSISQDNAPLYIIDGFPSEEGLKNISTSDIQNIDVLKDASSTAIYGARGANGVVLITTKGGSEGKANVTYDGWAGFRQLGKKLEVMNGMEFLKYQYERQAYTGNTGPSDEFIAKYGPWDSFNRYESIQPVNWQDKILGGNAYYQNHNVSINGGTKTTTYRLSYSHDDEEGLLAGNGFDRDNFKLRLDQKVTEKLSFSSNASYSHTKVTGGGTSEKSILNNVVMYRPVSGLGDPAVGPAPGEADYQDFLQSDEDAVSGLVNIATESLAKHRLTANGVLTFNAAFDYKFTPNLTLRLLGGMTLNNQRHEEFDDMKSSEVISHGGPFGLINIKDNKKYNNTTLLTYKTTISDKNEISLMLGQEFVNDSYQMVEASAAMFDSDDIGLASLAYGNEFPKPQSRLESNKLLSFFGRAFYSYKSKYIFSGTFRADGSSKFIEANRWGYFPSAAFAWQAVEESFIKSLNIFSNLKGRLTYGVAGNNRISNNQYSSIFNNVFYAADGTATSVGLIPNATANPDLKWETTISRNLGVDIGFFDNRLSANVDFYSNTTKDLLLQTQIPSSSGYTKQFKNVGSTENRGVEVTLNTRNFNSKNFYWNTDFNVAFFKNKVTGLNKEATFSQESFLSTIYWSAAQEAFMVKVGEPLGLIYGFVSDGFYGVDDFNYDPVTKVYTVKNGIARIEGTILKPGDMKFKDLGGAPDAGGNPTITATDDRTIIGRTQPKLFGGINNTFTFKNFDMSVFINFSVGNDILNANKILYSTGYNTNRNLLTVMRGYFTYVNDLGEFVSDPVALKELNKDATIWAPERQTPRRVYSWAVEDGSFIRVNNVTLGYTLPNTISQKLKMEKFRVFATAYNLALITKYSGYDPEVNGVRSTPYTPGVDQSSYPKSRSFIAGLNITF